jgi:hypothetical protein
MNSKERRIIREWVPMVLYVPVSLQSAIIVRSWNCAFCERICALANFSADFRTSSGGNELGFAYIANI